MSMPFFYIAILKGIISQSNRYHNDCLYKNCIKLAKKKNLSVLKGSYCVFKIILLISPEE